MFISGQIGLIPKSMTMPTPSNLPLELVLSMQHAERIAALAMETLGTSSRSQRNESAILWMTDPSAVHKVCDIWSTVVEVRLQSYLVLHLRARVSHISTILTTA